MKQATARTGRVLVIDDAKEVADVTVAVLRSLGYVAEAVYDGTAAMSKAVSFEPDFVLIDLVMPEMDGFALLRELRGMFPRKSPRLIAYSGYTQPAFQEAASAAGFDAYLTKPISEEALLRALAAPPAA